MQISGYEPKDVQHRDKGICWRCLADRTGWEREGLRPVLDRAFIVEGLEEWNMDERRNRVEKAGLCWHCGADRGCETCGSGKMQYSGEKEVLGIKVKRGRVEAGVSKGKGANKRLKIDHAGSSASTPFFEQQPLNPSLQQYDFSSGDYGNESSYDQFAQPTSIFNYQSQEVQLQAPVPQYTPGTWQNEQDFQDHGMYLDDLGDGQIDPSLYQQQGGEQVQQSFNLLLRQSQELPPILDFGADSVS